MTPKDLEQVIAKEFYFTAKDGVYGSRNYLVTAEEDNVLICLTFCVLVLRNGFTVTGESACVSAANYNAEVGKRVAREHALAKLWPLLGYALKEKLNSITNENVEVS